MKINKNPPSNNIWLYIKKNGSSIALGAALIILLISPDAKSFILRQLMTTGIFNASIDKTDPDLSTEFPHDFDFKDDKGKVYNTTSLRGKVVFINFWASWCPPCRAEFPSIERLYSNFKSESSVFFLTINEDDDITKAKMYLKKEKLSVPFFKSNGNIPSSIYTGTLPTTIVLDKKGKVRFRHEGFADYGSDKFIKQINLMINE